MKMTCNQVLTKQHENRLFKIYFFWANYNDSYKADFLFSKALLMNLESH